MSQTDRRLRPMLKMGRSRTEDELPRTRMERTLTGLFDRLFTPLNPLRSANERHWHPFTDIYEAESFLLVRMELAGIDAARLEVVKDGSYLIVRGQRSDPYACRGLACHQLEISHGTFERVVCLPVEFSESDIRADYGTRSGFLEITIAKERP